MDNDYLFNHDIEQNVLCALLDAKWLPEIIGDLKPEYFHDAQNRFIFCAIQNLFKNNTPVDTTILIDHFKGIGKLNDVGGVMKILNIFNASPTLINTNHLVERLKEYHYRREIESAAKSLHELVKTSGDINKAESIVMSIRDDDNNLDFDNMSEASGNVLTSYNKRKFNEEDPDKLITGYDFFDETTGGLYAGQLIVIAARPGVGKSTLALNICKNVSEKSKETTDEKSEKVQKEKQILFLSLEMTKEEIGRKIALCIAGRSEEFFIRNPHLEKIYFSALEAVANRKNLHVVSHAHVNIMHVKALAQRVKHKYKTIDLIVIDYLQLMEGGSVKNATREREIADMTRGLKLMAKEFNVPVIVLSQLNRSIDSRMVKIPKLSDLRESGAIEQDADKVFLIYNFLDAYSDRDTEEGLKHVIVIDCPKNRQGKVASQYFCFNREVSKVQELDKKQVGAINECKNKNEEDY